MATVTLDGLASETDYIYKVALLQEGAIGELTWENLKKLEEFSFKTFSAEGASTTFIFGSCRHYGNLPPRQGDTAFIGIDRHKNHQADFLLMGGDQIYADYPTKYLGSYNPFKLNTPPKSYDGFLDKYRIYYDQKGFRKVTGNLPSYMVYDDHEIQNNWSHGAFNDRWHKKFVKFETETYDNGIKAYFAHQAIFSPVMHPAHNPGIARLNWSGKGVISAALKNTKYYYEFTHGDCVFFVMDVRGQRKTLAVDRNGSLQGYYNKTVKMIGEDQKLALYDFLERNKNEQKVKFVVSPTPFFPDYIGGFSSPRDIWTGYAAQREEIINEIRRIAESKDDSYVLPVFLGGDVHQSLIATLTCKTSDPEKPMVLHSVVSSAFNWYIFGVQSGAGQSGKLISKYRSDKNFEKGDMNCEVIGESEITKNNYAVITVNNGDITISQFKVGWFRNKLINSHPISRDQLSLRST